MSCILFVKRLNLIIISALVLLCINYSYPQPYEAKAYVQKLQDVFMTSLVFPQEQNEIQLSMGTSLIREQGEFQFSIPMEIEYGITDFWQVSIEWVPSSITNQNAEFEKNMAHDLEFGTQFSLMNIFNSNFHSAVGFEVGIPFRDNKKDFSSGEFEFQPYLLIAKDFPRFNYAQLFAQFAVEFKNSGEMTENNESNEWHFGIGCFMPLSSLILTSELNFYSDREDKETHIQQYYTPGIIYKLNKNWEAGIGIPIGLNSESYRYGIIAHLIFEFDID